MDTSTDNLRKLFDSIRTISLWERIFRWGCIKNQLFDAIADLQKLHVSAESYREQLIKSEIKFSGLAKDHELANASLYKKELEAHELKEIINKSNIKIRQLEVEGSSVSSTIQAQNEQIETLEGERAGLKYELRSAIEELNQLKHQNTKLQKDDEFRKQEHSNALSTLTRIQNQIQEVRQKEVDEKNRVEQERISKLKETWSNHQENVRNTIKSICSKHTIEYVDKVPFKGEPDNTLKICDEFVIFDAKSPAGEDMSNFPSYLKDQAEKARKYCREECVKKDIFLVVPSNTLFKLSHFVYKLADYSVYIVAVDSLEPLILSLQKLEEYEFVEQLSPEERENICRVLGKFAHLTKRRIQIDTFFIKQFMELAYKCESDLPSDILNKVVEFEKAEKLNPPTERRSKQISLKELEKDTSKLRSETSTKGIAAIEEIISSELNKMPLYTDDNEIRINDEMIAESENAI